MIRFVGRDIARLEQCPYMRESFRVTRIVQPLSSFLPELSPSGDLSGFSPDATAMSDLHEFVRRERLLPVAMRSRLPSALHLAMARGIRRLSPSCHAFSSSNRRPVRIAVCAPRIGRSFDKSSSTMPIKAHSMRAPSWRRRRTGTINGYGRGGGKGMWAD